MSVCSNLPARETPPSLSNVLDSPSRIDAEDEGLNTFWQRKRKTVRKTLARAKARRDSASKTFVVGLFRSLYKDLGDAAPVSASPSPMKSPSAHSLSIKTPLSTACKSKRVSNAGVPILERAERLAVAWDTLVIGMISLSSPK